MKWLVKSILMTSLLATSNAHNTWWGPTGLIQVPTTTIVRPEETSAGMYTSVGGGDAYLGMNVNFAFSDQVEIGLSDTLSFKGRQNSSTIFSMKYVPMTNLAVGALIDSNDQYKHTLYSILGSPQNSVYLGVGLNFGNGGAKKAVLGNYSRVKNDMETLFFMAGAKFDMSQWYPSLEGVLEYNGDTMSIGLGYIPKNNWDLQVDYMTSGDLIPDNRVVLSLGSKF